MTSPSDMPYRFAVFADPHYVDLFPSYPIAGVDVGGRPGAAVHTLADSAVSTRLFNEGYFALPAALERCRAHGVRIVVIAGDLSDDGQASAMAGAVALLKSYEAVHGMRFFLTPGNHDAHGMSGRDIARRLLNPDGSALSVGSADPAAMAGLAGPYVRDPRQRCQDYPALLRQWASFGLMRQAGDLHWESPFGPDDVPESRFFTMRSPDGRSEHRQLDLSYLVEPEPGLWLLSIDANVYAPRDAYPRNDRPEAFEDSTAAGWPALVRHKPFILDWMADVARRADALGKTLVCFSHYPMIDPLDGTAALERELLGETMSVRRTPSPEVSRRLCATGISTHFSGHMHIYDRADLESGGNRLTNYALPSLVAFPAAIALVEAAGRAVDMRFEPLELATHSALFPAYRAEMARAGDTGDWLEAGTYGAFLLAHVAEQVARRMLAQEWPTPLARFIAGHTLSDMLAALGRAGEAPAGLDAPFASIPLTRFAADLHALRMGSDMALDMLPADRLSAYRALTRLAQGRAPAPPGSLARQLEILLAMFDRFSAPGHAVAWTGPGAAP